MSADEEIWSEAVVPKPIPVGQIPPPPAPGGSTIAGAQPESKGPGLLPWVVIGAVCVVGAAFVLRRELARRA